MNHIQTMTIAKAFNTFQNKVGNSFKDLDKGFDKFGKGLDDFGKDVGKFAGNVFDKLGKFGENLLDLPGFLMKTLPILIIGGLGLGAFVTLVKRDK